MVERCGFGKAHSGERTVPQTSSLPWDAMCADDRAGSGGSQANFAGGDWEP